MTSTGFGLLSLITFFPLVGAVAIASLNKEAKGNARWIALYMTLFTLGASIYLWANFDQGNPGFQFVEEMDWLGGSIRYKMGVDGISVLFVVLTAFLMPLCILASWQSIEERVKEYMIAFLVLETLMIGVFCALDLILFYLFFEGGLIPMFLIIGIWGGARRVYASFKFFLYTLLGSVLMLLAMMAMYWHAGTTDIPTLLTHKFPADMQWWLWLAFFASFAVKMPMWPVHTWLPDAHVEAPTAGSVILAGILLKMGGYGFLRFSLPMFPVASQEFAPLVFALSVIAIVYTSLVALAQEDVKKLIAYSSVAHMGFVTMGIFSFTVQGVDGAIFQMLSHGLVSAAKERVGVSAVCTQLQVKAPSIETKTANLSGGNQQKVVLAKWLALGPKVLIVDEPTRGIDVGAKAEIYTLLRNLARAGVAIVMISSDMEEILNMSDRVAVMHDGAITGMLARGECTEERIMTLAVG